MNPTNHQVELFVFRGAINFASRAEVIKRDCMKFFTRDHSESTGSFHQGHRHGLY